MSTQVACLLENQINNNDDNVTLWNLAHGPSHKAFSYQRMEINGFHLRTQVADEGKKNQNSGVAVYFDTNSRSSVKDQNPKRSFVRFFGKIRMILQLDFGSFTTILLLCDWFRSDTKGKSASVKQDKYGFQLVNTTKIIGSSSLDQQPFVMPSHVHQVFYIEDQREHDWSVVLDHVPRGCIDNSHILDFSTTRDFSCPPLFPHDMIDICDDRRNDEDIITVDEITNHENIAGVEIDDVSSDE